MDKILKCCGGEPIIYDFTPDYIRSESWNQIMIICSKCGHHIHSEEKDYDKIIPVWNRSSRKEEMEKI